MPRLALLLDAALPSDLFPQIKELGAADPAFAENLDLLDAGRVEREGPLDADAVGDPTDGKRRAQPAAAAPDHGTLERLQTIAAALRHLHVHAHGISGGKRRQSRSDLLAFDRGDPLHNTNAPQPRK